MAAQAGKALPAGDVMGGDHAVADRQPRDVHTDVDDVPRDLMAQDQGSAFDAVPLHEVGAADAAGPDLDEHVAAPHLGDGLLLDAHVEVAVVHPYFHDPLRSR